MNWWWFDCADDYCDDNDDVVNRDCDGDSDGDGDTDGDGDGDGDGDTDGDGDGDGAFVFNSLWL